MSEVEILKQWVVLKETGLAKANSMLSQLLIAGLSLAIFIGLLIYFGGSVVLIAFLSLALGWSIAERNALRSRACLWPKLEKYLDWKSINKKLSP